MAYSRDKRSDCVQAVIALVVTPEGFPLGYEVLPGDTADCTTLRDLLIEAQYGKANRVWVMDRGIPTEQVLAEMRAADPQVSYLVGTPKGRLSKLEKHLVTLPWQAVREGVDVKLLPRDQELYSLPSLKMTATSESLSLQGSDGGDSWSGISPAKTRPSCGGSTSNSSRSRPPSRP
jgi:hypothetical protein